MRSMNPHRVTAGFEAALADYTGAPYVVTTNSCTMALLLAVQWHLRPSPDLTLDELSQPLIQRQRISIPKRTYVGVPMSIIHAGGWPEFRDEDWREGGFYSLDPLPVWDCARRLTSGMWWQWFGNASAMACLSFHATKTLGIEQGGAILLDNPEADAWLRRMRFDGRTAGIPVADDRIREVGWHCYMNPSTAAQGLMRMAGLPKYNAALPWDNYPDLSQMEVFKWA